MKWKHAVLTVLLLAAAVVLGWFLPTLAAARFDRSLEGRAEPVSIRQIDLSYRFDLSLADKLRLISGPSEQVTLERGVYLTEAEAKEIGAAFLQDLTGQQPESERELSAVPLLISFGTEGSLVVWFFGASLNPAWSCDLYLDDQTGLLLRGTFQGDAATWDLLLPELGGAKDFTEGLRAALTKAMTAHCHSRLPGSALEAEANDGPLGVFGSLLLETPDDKQIQIPFRLIAAMGRLEVNY